MKTLLFLITLSLLSCQKNSENKKDSVDSDFKEVPTNFEKSESIITYNEYIKPLFKETCLPCHGSGNELNWMDYKNVIKYEKEILGSIKRDGNYTPMPIAKKLSSENIALVEQWILDGSKESSKELYQEEITQNIEVTSSYLLGEGLYKSNCMGCHQDTTKYPNLLGQNKKYIKEQFKKFKLSQRANSDMSLYSNEVLSDEKSVEYIAEYLSKQDPCATEVAFDSLNVHQEDIFPSYTKGKKVYNQYCKNCHEGENQIGFPDITGLNPNYVYESLMSFRNSSRNSNVMKTLLRRLGNEDIIHVSEFLGKQRRCKK